MGSSFIMTRHKTKRLVELSRDGIGCANVKPLEAELCDCDHLVNQYPPNALTTAILHDV
jgi:hypothetical protein